MPPIFDKWWEKFFFQVCAQTTVRIDAYFSPSMTSFPPQLNPSSDSNHTDLVQIIREETPISTSGCIFSVLTQLVEGQYALSCPTPSDVHPPIEILCLSLSLCLPLSMSLCSSMLLCMSLLSFPTQLLMRVHTILRYQVCGVCVPLFNCHCVLLWTCICVFHVQFATR